MVDLRSLAIETAFLLQLASGRRVSWTHAIKIPPGYLRKDNGGYAFKPEILLDKNQSMDYIPPPVFIAALASRFPSEKPNCPIRAPNVYLARNAPLRGAIKYLFLMNKKPIRVARKTTVANWSKIVIIGCQATYLT